MRNFVITDGPSNVCGNTWEVRANVEGEAKPLVCRLPFINAELWLSSGQMLRSFEDYLRDSLDYFDAYGCF